MSVKQAHKCIYMIYDQYIPDRRKANDKLETMKRLRVCIVESRDWARDR